MDSITSVDEIITRSARLYGSRIAYCHDGETLNFRQLAHDADHLAHRLRLFGVTTGEPVAVLLEKSLNFIRALAAILRTGAIYVPVDPGNPDDRVRYILRDSGAMHVITTSPSLPRMLALVDPNVRFICVDDPAENALGQRLGRRTQRLVEANDLAYIIYTSGSTQMPKGVAIRHKSLLNYIRETVKMYRFDEHTRVLCVKSFSYDASLTDIFCPLYSGGAVYLMDERLIFPAVIEDKIQRYGITHISCTLPVFKLLAHKSAFDPKVYSTMKTMSIGGDIVMPEAFHRIRSKLPGIRLFNRYGPTEATVACCTYEVTGKTVFNQRIPIGKPHGNVRFRAVNKRGEPIGVNEAGELFIGGVQVMAGYWKSPELTAKVITDVGDGLRYFKTSDLVTLDANGDYVFVRRVDDVVKKNGYRISLDEIEAAIVRAGLADECVCVFIPESEESDLRRAKIVAYLKTDGAREPDQETRKKLHLLLPKHMVPDIIVHTDIIPKELSGKPARQVLKRNFLDGIKPSDTHAGATQP